MEDAWFALLDKMDSVGVPVYSVVTPLEDAGVPEPDLDSSPRHAVVRIFPPAPFRSRALSSFLRLVSLYGFWGIAGSAAIVDRTSRFAVE